MTLLHFTKLQGLGNDFIVIDGPELPACSQAELAVLARRLCDRHFGIGADGLILCWPSEKALARMQILNADGSEPEMCGNGLRCLARYLQLEQRLSLDHFSLETAAGILPIEMNHLDQTQDIQVNMGLPILEAERIPSTGFAQSPVIRQQLQAEEHLFEVSLVSMGNPHCVIPVSALDAVDFDYWGPRLEQHAAFPARINVEFVEVLAADHARVKVWERGAGPTLACGTGACAVLVAGVLGQWLEPQARIDLPGGGLEISWPEQQGPVWMKGPAKRVFAGQIELEGLYG